MKYLVCVDDSSYATSTFNLATTIMNKKDDELFIMSVTEAVPAYFGGVMYAPAIREAEAAIERRTRANLQYFGKTAKALGVNVKLLTSVSGDAGQVICKACEKKGIDFLIVGRRGMGKFQRFFMGSTSKYLVENAPCDVIVCKGKWGPAEEHDSDVDAVRIAEERERTERVLAEEATEHREKAKSQIDEWKAIEAEEKERKRRIEEWNSLIQKEEQDRTAAKIGAVIEEEEERKRREENLGDEAQAKQIASKLSAMIKGLDNDHEIEVFNHDD